MVEAHGMERLGHAAKGHSSHMATPKLPSPDRDRRDLASIGKKEILKRRFGFMSMLGMSTTLAATWEGVLAYVAPASQRFSRIIEVLPTSFFVVGLANGGPAGLIYSFLIAWMGFLAVMASLAELASMAPTAGGQYHWVAVLAPKSNRKVLSYITGWLSVTFWQVVVAASGFLCGTFIQGLIVLNNPTSYIFKRWHGTLLFWATILLALFVNTVLARWLPKIEGFILALHVLGFFAIIFPLVYLSNHTPTSEVFTQFLNEGNLPTQGISFLVGMISGIGSFVGADGSIHMSEEIHNASIVVPWTMVSTLIINGLLGIGMLVAAVFCVGDVRTALESPTGYPFIQVFYGATNSLAGTTIMVCIPLVLSFCAAFGQFASASRQMWSFARDRGLPFSNQLSSVNPASTLPIYAIATTSVISLLLALVNIGSAFALNIILSLLVNTWLASAFIPLVLLLWRRSTGGIAPRSTLTYGVSDFEGPLRPRWGPWKIPEPFGTIVNCVSLAFISVAFFFSFWPSTIPVTKENMNFSSLMTGSLVISSIVFYYAGGRKAYKGPIIEIRDDCG